MSIEELKPLIRKGEVGIIPNWIGYIKWNYSTDELNFVNGDYRLSESELLDTLKNRNDLYYII